MVSASSIAAIVTTLIVTLVGPIVLAIVGVRRWKLPVAGVVAGVATFGVSQLLFRIPLLQVAETSAWFQAIAATMFGLALFLSVTAGLVEELGRFIAFRFPLRRRLNWRMGLALGIGHGGFESVMLLGLTYVNNLAYSLMINAGTFDSQVGPALGPMAAQLKRALITTPPVLFLGAGAERVMTIVIHIALSMLVLYGVKTGQFRWVVAAIAAHALVNFPAVMLVGYGYGMWSALLWLLLLTVVGAVYIGRSRGSLG